MFNNAPPFQRIDNEQGPLEQENATRYHSNGPKKMLMDHVLVTPIKRTRSSSGSSSHHALVRSRTSTSTSVRHNGVRVTGRCASLPTYKRHARFPSLFALDTPRYSKRKDRRTVLHQNDGDQNWDPSSITLSPVKRPSKQTRFSLPLQPQMHVSKSSGTIEGHNVPEDDIRLGFQTLKINGEGSSSNSWPTENTLVDADIYVPSKVQNLITSMNQALEREMEARRIAEDNHRLELSRRMEAEVLVEKLQRERDQYLRGQFIQQEEATSTMFLPTNC